MTQIEEVLNNTYKIEKEKSDNFIYKEYFARDIRSNEPVIVKILYNSALSLQIENVIRYHNDLYTISQINHPSIHRIYTFFDEANTHFLINEYFKGETLHSLFKQKVLFSLYESIDIIIQIAEALETIHKKNIFLRHITSRDILITRYHEKNIPFIKLTNIGFIHIIDFTKIADQEDIVSIFPYMSPEECGVLKRTISASSDLYSLGILFYKLLTQQLPFTGLSLSSIIHQHIAQVPKIPSSINPEIPWILDSIIMKLLAKDPGIRYQSAKGLINDLERLKKGKKDFLPGIDDEILNLSFKTDLIGREKELRVIKDTISEIINTKKGRVCFIKGKSGIGKSRLLEEVKSYSFSKEITYISGKCFSDRNKTPYGPIKDTLINYLIIYNTYKKEKKEKIKEMITQNIHELGQILLDFLPQLQTLIGECPSLVSLDKEKESRRFLGIISNFICVLAKAENGLIIAIDDMQWLDEGTFEVLNTILYEISSSPLCILGTYRKNEVQENHGILQFIKNTNSLKIPLTTIDCPPFNSKYMFLFIASLLHNKTHTIKEISNFIHKKSKGNPFFAIEILKHLTSNKAMYFQYEKWNIDWDIIHTLEFPPTILNLVMKRISQLKEIETSIISHAAVIGREFEIDLLYKLVSYGKKVIVEVVDKAIYLQLLEFDPYKSKVLFFVHDRIKEAFYAKLSDTKKTELHLKIAYVLEEEYKRGKHDILFQLAHHYIEGKKEDKILQFAFPAGIKAKENYAHNEAIKYLRKTIEILLEKNDSDKDIVIAQKNLAEIYLTIGNYDKSITLFDKILPLLDSDIKRAHVYHMITSAYYKKGDFIKCEEYGRIGLRLLGEKLPVTRLSVVTGIIKEFLTHMIHNIFLSRPVKPKENINGEKSGKYKLIISFYVTLNWLFSISDLSKFVRSILRMLNISKSKIGKSKEYGIGLVANAMLYSAIPLFKQAITYNQEALKLRKEISDEYGITQSLQLLGFCYEWMGNYNTAISHFTDSMDRFKKFGDIKEYEVSLIGKVECLLYLSDYANAQHLLNQYETIARKTNDIYARINAKENKFKLLFEKGHLDDAERYLVQAYNESYKYNLWPIHILATIDTGRLYLEKNNIYKAQEYFEKAKQLIKKTSIMPHYRIYLFNLISEAYIKKYLYFHSINIKRNLIKKIRKSCKKALIKTKPWQTHHIEALRVNAQYYALIKKNRKAEEFFCKSIELGEKLERKYELGKSFYEYGIFLKNTGKTIESKQKIEFAYKIFDEINVINLKEKMSVELGSNKTTENHPPIVKLMDKQRFASIIKVSQDICSILNPDELVEEVLQKAIEIVGAQSGYLFIKDENTDELKIQVSKNIIDAAIPEWILEIVNKVYFTEKTIITNEIKTNKSVICVPLLYKNEAIGVCYLYNNLSHNIFADEDKEILEVIMTQAAISLVNARLYELATVDGLTKLYIHRHFQLLLHTELKRSKRYNHPCSLIMADIDHFKKVNDTYGHQFGDKVLQETATFIRSNCRSTDIPARYGGEEFSVILPETNRDNALLVAEKIRNSIKKNVFSYSGNKVQISISLGVAEYPFNALNKDSLIEAADKALYISKEKGRNRVTVFEQKIE
ncbi:MAG: diguanylate cyclase [Spirochaetales bacterium]|nr:diguanylate cyclase [Spirochaetales bacterium]